MEITRRRHESIGIDNLYCQYAPKRILHVSISPDSTYIADCKILKQVRREGFDGIRKIRGIRCYIQKD